MSKRTRALITGVNGFAGSHLADLLLTLDCAVGGAISPSGSRANLQHIQGDIELLECDLCDRQRVAEVIASFAPDLIFHLAAKTQDQETRLNPRLALETNVLGTIHVLDAVLAAGAGAGGTKVLVAGSSAEYGRVAPADNPIREDHPFNPVGMYGVSKISQGMTALHYHLAHGLPVIRTRAFNHTGPRQAAHFAIPAFALQIAEIEAGLRPPILSVGDLSQSRDLSDVRDVVRGYYAAATLGVAGEVYNIASGAAVRTQDVLDSLLGMSTAKIEVTVDAARLRPGEVAVQIGDAGKLTRQTGWRPQIPLERTLSDTLEYWRLQVRQPAIKT